MDSDATRKIYKKLFGVMPSAWSEKEDFIKDEIGDSICDGGGCT